MPSQTNNRVTADNGTRRYKEDDAEYWELLDLNHHEDNRFRALTSQLQQAARAHRQPLEQLSPVAVTSAKSFSVLPVGFLLASCRFISFMKQQKLLFLFIKLMKHQIAKPLDRKVMKLKMQTYLLLMEQTEAGSH